MSIFKFFNGQDLCRRGENGLFFSNLEESIQVLNIKYDVRPKFHWKSFIELRKFFSIPKLLRVFTLNVCQILSSSFSHLLKFNLYFSIFFNIVNYINWFWKF